MSCDQIRELLEAYALGALDSDEQAIVESHLVTCADCRRLADQYATLVSRLPQALAVASPLRLPSNLKSRVLQSVQAASATSHDQSPRREPAPEKVSVTGRSRFAWLNLRTVGGLVVAILMIATLAWALQLNTELAQARALRAEYANLVDQQEVVLEVIDSSKTRKAQLSSPTSGSPAYGKLYTRPDLPNVVVMAARLPQPPSGQSYQLWLTQQGQTRLIGSLKIDSKGFGIIVFDAGQNGPVYEAARLVVQPEGSVRPDGSLILSWETSK